MVLVIVLCLRIAIPEIPGWLATEMAKVEFQRREAIKNAHAPLLVSVSFNFVKDFFVYLYIYLSSFPFFLFIAYCKLLRERVGAKECNISLYISV